MVYVGIAYETTLIKISFPTLESNFSIHLDNFVADFVGFYTCEWSPTLNNDENNEWLI